VIANKGNVLEQFTHFNDVDEFPKNILTEGRHCVLGIEGSRKSHFVIDMMVKLSDTKKGIPIICSFNTIDQQYEKYNTAVDIVTSLGWSEEKIKNKIKILPSTREIARNLFKDKIPWFAETMRMKCEGVERLDLISIHQKTWKLTKPSSSHPDHFGYNYQEDNKKFNLVISCNHIVNKLKQTNNHVKQHTLAIVSKNGDSPNPKLLKVFMDECINSLNEPWKYPKIKVKQKNLLDAITNKIKLHGKYLDVKENFELCIFTKDNINNSKDLLKENSRLVKYVRDLFNDESDSIVVFTQHEKFIYEFNPLMFPKGRIQWAVNNFRIFQDETPITKFFTLNIGILCNHVLSRAFYKKEEDLTSFEYNILKMMDPNAITRARNKIKNNPDSHHIVPLQGIVDLQVTNGAGFFQAQPQFRMKNERHNPMFTDYRNVLITTTEILDATYLNMVSYDVWQHNYKSSNDWEQWKPEWDDIEIFKITSGGLDTKKKNSKDLSKLIHKLKEENPNTLFIGKREWGCDTTIDAIKGSNKIYLDDKVKEMCIFLNPMNPNEIINYYSEIYDLLPEEEVPDNLHKLTMIQRRIDYINQACGRVLGPRKAYRSSYGMDKVKVKIYYSAADTVSEEAIRRCRYLHEDSQFSEIFFNLPACVTTEL
jgi:hypothetical protein